ncbi:MAG: antitoxin [Elusimicrobia bacterium]|nr:antitoxin [Elusimicrobiota bacterium]
MKKASGQYTIRKVPASVDAALRAKARRQGKSLNAVALEALRTGAGVAEQVRHRDLDSFFGSWVPDEAADKALKDQRRIDPDLWA